MIYFDSQIVPILVLWEPLQAGLCVFLSCPSLLLSGMQDVPGSSYTFPVLALRSAIYPRSLGVF